MNALSAMINRLSPSDLDMNDASRSERIMKAYDHEITVLMEFN